MQITELPHCEISGRPRWKVGKNYLVERDRRGQHLVTDQRTGVEYYVPWHRPGDFPLIEYEVVAKRGLRRTAYPEIVSARMLAPGGPRCREILKQIYAIPN